MARRIKRAVACLGMLVAFLFTGPAYALLVRPVVIELTSVGSGTSSQLEVVNDRNVPMTVEVKVQNLSIPEKGAPVLTSSNGDDFLIFPTIAKIPAGGRQIFRVRYIGDATPAQSRLYEFSTTELPVSLTPGENKAKVQVLYSINSVVAVRPPKSTPEIKIAGVARGINAKGQQGLEIMFENDGAAHGYVGGDSMVLSDGAWKKALDANAMSKAFGLGLIPPQSKRTMFLVLPEAPTSGAILGDLKHAS